MKDLSFYITSSDPLTRELAMFLIEYGEEDDRVDYKRNLDINCEKEWLNLVKDISAFANTRGGYLVFGVADDDKSLVGLPKNIENILKDANNIHSKINSYLDPELTAIRSKSFREKGKYFVVIFVPQSFNLTHIIKNDGVIYKQSNKPKMILKKGTFYVRRSSSNHLGDSRDLDDIVERRIDQFRDSLIDKIARVVSTPTDSNLFILSKDPEDQTGERFIIEDSPDSIAIKGMSFTVAPETSEQEIAAWRVLSKNKSYIKPPPEVIWNWYFLRDTLQLKESQKLAVFQFSLWVSAPIFFWIQGVENSKIRSVLLNAIRNRPISIEIKPFLAAASFLGKTTYKSVLESLGDFADRLPDRMKHFPAAGPRKEFGTFKLAKNQTPAKLIKIKLGELNSLVDEIVKSKRDPGLYKKWKAQDIDCFLFAKDDNYK